MRIDKQLHLVLDIFNDDADFDAKPPNPPTLRAVVHAAPIGAETFDAYFEPIGRVFAKMQAFTAISAPKIADKILRSVATEMGIWESDERAGRIGVKDGLVEEIHRLTNVLAPTKTGWRDLMFKEALDGSVLSAREAAEVDAMLIFFTVGSHMYPLQDARMALDGAMSLRGARVVYSSFTELKASLATSTAGGNSGAKAAGS